MLPRIRLGTALVPDTGKEMQLYQSGELFSIKIPGRGDLMNSRMHGSEKALADAEVVTAELVPEAVTWNRTLIGAPARDRAITSGSVPGRPRYLSAFDARKSRVMCSE